jgi:thioredoxin 2
VPAAAHDVPRCGRCDCVLPWLTTADDADFDSVVVDSSVPVLLDLWAPWWPPLTLVELGVPHVAETFAGSLKTVQVNAENAPGVVDRLAAFSVPMLLLLDSGRERDKQVGAIAPYAMQRWLAAALPA